MQLASAIGRDFKQDLLSKIASHITQLNEIILQSMQMELLYEIGPDHLRFKHALIQDTLYDSMLRELREKVHLAIANTLEEESKIDIDREQADILARKLT